MENTVSINKFLRAIKRLPEDPPVENPRVWYQTQKEHWIGWLSEYHGPGAYGRKVGAKRDAKFAYNHIVCPELLMYLIHAIPLGPERISAAEKAYQSGRSDMAKSGAIRKVVPWVEIEQAIWGNEKPSLLRHFWKRTKNWVQKFVKKR